MPEMFKEQATLMQTPEEWKKHKSTTPTKTKKVEFITPRESTKHVSTHGLSDACLVSYNSILEKTRHIGKIQKNTSRMDLLKKFRLLMRDPIMKSFDKATALSIHTHLSSFLVEEDDTSLGDIYTSVSNIVTMYLHKQNIDQTTSIKTLRLAQSRLQAILYNGTKPFTPVMIADMIWATVSTPA